MKIYYAALATIVVASLIVFGVICSNSLREMADAEKAQTASKNEKTGESFTFSETDQPSKSDGNGTVIDESAFRPKKTAEEKLELEMVRANQLNKLMNLGFHKAAGMSEADFSALAPMPDSEDAILAVSESLVSIGQQCALLGINNLVNASEHFNLVPVPDGKLYWRYGLDEGGRMLGISVAAARENLDKRGRYGATTVEVIAIYVQAPDVLDRFFLDAAGSQCRGNISPHLCRRDNGQLELATALINRGHREWASPSFIK